MFNSWFEQMLSAFTSDSITTISQSNGSSETKKKESIPVNNLEAPDFETKYAGDIYSLCQKFGVLYKGQSIELSLQEILSICPRSRRRADAYTSLINGLRENLNVCLTIKSNKSKNE